MVRGVGVGRDKVEGRRGEEREGGEGRGDREEGKRRDWERGRRGETGWNRGEGCRGETGE